MRGQSSRLIATRSWRRCVGTVRDEWGDEAFAREWTFKGGVDRTNPERQRFQKMLGTLVKKRLASSVAGEGVLDIGCGSGLSAKAIVESVGAIPRLVGVDGSEAMLTLAKEVCPEMTTKHVDFTKPLEVALGGPFKAVICSQVLHELPLEAKSAAVQLARSALAPGGCFYIQDRFLKAVEPGVPADDYEAIWEVLKNDDTMPWPQYSNYIQDKLDDATSEEALVALLKEHFDDVEVLYRVFNRSLIVARV